MISIGEITLNLHGLKMKRGIPYLINGQSVRVRQVVVKNLLSVQKFHPWDIVRFV